MKLNFPSARVCVCVSEYSLCVWRWAAFDRSQDDDGTATLALFTWFASLWGRSDEICYLFIQIVSVLPSSCYCLND